MRLLTISCALLLLGCGKQAEVSVTHFKAMGTTGTVKVRGAAVPLFDVVHKLDFLLSHWDPDSTLSKFNRSPAGTPFSAPPEFIDIVILANELHQRTNGAFDVALGSGKIEADPAAKTLTRSQPKTRIDLSAIAKGYAIDRLAEAIEGDDYLIEFGGELRAGAGGSWTVGIEHADGSGALGRTIELQGKSVATSGTYRLGEHIVDPRTGKPATTNVRSASVLADSAAEADALATALMVTGVPIEDSLLVFKDGSQQSLGLFTPAPD